MKRNNAEEIGIMVKTHRKLYGMTQFELAEKIEIDDKQIGKIECGKHYPSVPTFLKLIEVLNINIKEFYDEVKLQDNKTMNKIMKIIKNASEKELELMYNIFSAVKKQSK